MARLRVLGDGGLPARAEPGVGRASAFRRTATTSAPSTAVTAATTNGTCASVHSSIFGANQGAAAAANQRTKLYPALATGRGASDTPSASSVYTVLFTPMRAPDRTVQTTAVVWSPYPRTSTSAASSTSEPPSTFSEPKRRCSRGAAITEKTASSTPQAKNTAPDRYGDMSSTNGVKASTVKNV